MVFLDSARTEIRNWLAGSASTYPAYFLFGTSSTTPTRATTQMSNVILAKVFSITDTSIIRQVRYEAIALTTEATGSTISQLGISTATSGTSGVNYIIETISPIEKNNTFDLQVIGILEVD